MAKSFVTRFTTSATNEVLACGFNHSFGPRSGWLTQSEATRLSGLSVVARDKCCKGAKIQAHTHRVWWAGGMWIFGTDLEKSFTSPETADLSLLLLFTRYTGSVSFGNSPPLSFLVRQSSCWNTFSLSCLLYRQLQSF